MKRMVFALFVIHLLLTSCDDNDNDCSPETTQSIWTPGKEIVAKYDTVYERYHYFEIDGDKIIFEFNHSGAQCAHIYDDEWGEVLKFQIEDSVTHFEFTDKEILTTNCHYSEYGAWVSFIQTQVENGTIKGEKQSDSNWKITMSISTNPRWENDRPTVIELEEIFSN